VDALEGRLTVLIILRPESAVSVPSPLRIFIMYPCDGLHLWGVVVGARRPRIFHRPDDAVAFAREQARAHERTGGTAQVLHEDACGTWHVVRA
jgi:hypothetical protein